MFNNQNFCIVDITRGSTIHTGRIVAFPLQQWFSKSKQRTLVHFLSCF